MFLLSIFDLYLTFLFLLQFYQSYQHYKEKVETNLLPKSTEDFNAYKNPDNDPLGNWVVGDPIAKDLTLNNKNIYAIQNPFSGELIYPRKNANSQGQD